MRQVFMDVGLGLLFEGRYIVLTLVSQWTSNVGRALHLVRKPVNRFGRWNWWLCRVPIPGSCLRGEFVMWVRTQGGKSNLACVQVIDHSLKAVAGRSGVNIDSDGFCVRYRCHIGDERNPPHPQQIFVLPGVKQLVEID